MTELKARYRPGDTVVLCDDITGTVDRVIFALGRSEALYLVNWWLNGGVCEREFCESELGDVPDG